MRAPMSMCSSIPIRRAGSASTSSWRFTSCCRSGLARRSATPHARACIGCSAPRSRQAPFASSDARLARSRRCPMAATDKLFAGSIPEIYDRFLVPLIFEPHARDLACRVAETAPGDVLETAAGTGALTRELVRCLPQAYIVATDLNQPMLDHAAARQPCGSRVVWRQADALALPFDDGSFDAVACQFGVMFLPDKV